MTDHAKIRAWLKAHDAPALMLIRDYVDIFNKIETPKREYRLILLLGQMDYTTAITADVEDFKNEPEATLKRVLDRVAFETKRDTTRDVDVEAALRMGEQYMKENKK